MIGIDRHDIIPGRNRLMGSKFTVGVKWTGSTPSRALEHRPDRVVLKTDRVTRGLSGQAELRQWLRSQQTKIVTCTFITALHGTVVESISNRFEQCFAIPKFRLNGDKERQSAST